MNHQEVREKLIMSFDLIESQKCRSDLLFHAETVLRAQEALKEDYGLNGPGEGAAGAEEGEV